ncbi:pentatricopeptide repeat-containing protein [Prunus yedoensis var. nudiflora]|uniref:Pentatricopeptide repeat-containing protein n=1 Tax=Prunus yedoensis var. nudiflora TaxID=2094558 RepID=A0A314UDW2_PRUYE|nr:pentatricopeptide repeat-containing protein [Prunus yedoensis var. nudiflora]
MFCKQLQLHLSHNIDEVTVTLAVKACPGDPKPGCQIHGFAVSSGFASYTTVSNSLMNGEVFVGNALISMYPRWRRLIEARSVFDEIANEDLVSWNAILSGYSQEGKHGLEAIFVFVEMVGEGMGTWETDTWLDN